MAKSPENMTPDERLTLWRGVTYRLYPTDGQSRRLHHLLRSQCELYNAALEHRRGAWRWGQQQVTLFDQLRLLSGPEAREAIPSLLNYGLRVHRGTLRRLDGAFQGFFARIKSGTGKPGYPRFKSVARFNSVIYAEARDWRIYSTGRGSYGRLRILGVGHVSVRLAHGAHARTGTPSRLVIRRTGRGRHVRWSATVFYKNVDPRPTKEPRIEAGGVDRGIAILAAVVGTDGSEELIANPCHLAKAEARLAAKQRRLARAQRGSNRRRRLIDDIASAHRRVRQARLESNHQLSRHLVDEYDTVIMEDLRINNMTHRPEPRPDGEGGYERNGATAKAKLNKAILDAGWGQLARMVSYKAEEAGRTLMLVDPRHTSQQCSACGHTDRESRVTRDLFVCVACGHEAHADLNAARNLLQRGGFHPEVFTARIGPRTPHGVKPRIDSPPVPR